ncbi:hypothetical protein C1646_672266 [Rhizophagus diaphanus]|nr:hypothetical protein C1646_672266 [Rhizophagus diaphanus] [Rhizophagus sp. MUCL 43196]
MRFVSAALLSKPDHTSQKEGEKLEKLYLSVEEKEFLQEMMKLLEPIERVTRHLCGAEYPTLSLVYPYIELLKKKFAPKDNESVQTYINLIYGESYEDDDDSVTDDDIPTAGAHQHWQYAHRQFCQKMKNTHVQGQNIRNQELKQSLNAPGIEEPLIMNKSYKENDFFLELEGGLQKNPEDSEARYEFHIKCANYVQKIKNAIMNVFGKIFIGDYPVAHPPKSQFRPFLKNKNITIVLSGESIIKCMAEKAKANEDMELQQKSNELDDEEAENENVKNDEIAKDRNANNENANDKNADDENADDENAENVDI